MRWVRERFIGFDYETSGTMTEFALQPWRIASGDCFATSLAAIQLYTPDNKPALVMGGVNHDAQPNNLTVQKMRDFLQYAIDNNLRIVGWNVVFDLMVLIGYGLWDLVKQCKFLDGMLILRHAVIEPEYEATNWKDRKSYSLKPAVAELYPQYANYAEDVEFHNSAPPARRKLHKYNVRDTTFTLMITEYWWNRLTNEQQRCALIEAECLAVVARANVTGMDLDLLAIAELQQHLANVAEEKITLLRPLGVTEAIARSPMKLAQKLFDDWQLPVLKENVGAKTGRISRATDKEVLHELALIDPRAKVLREYREALNNRTKFSKALADSAAYNGGLKTYPLARVFGTYSGRITVSSDQKIMVPDKKGTGMKQGKAPTGFAQHQMKNGSEFRAQVKAPLGHTIVEFDAAGQEFRWMAIQSGDEVMLQLCMPGEDAHSFMGAQIGHKDYKGLMIERKSSDKIIKDAAEALRKLGKIGNLSLQYRTKPKRLRTVARVQYNLPMELPEAQMIWTTYQRSYIKVPVYWAKQISKVKRLGYAETLAGRRVQVVGDWGGPLGWQMEGTSINYPIQGTGADQKYLAIMILKDLMNEYDAKFAWDLHDGLYFYVPDDKAMAFAIAAKKRLDNLPYKEAWGFTPPIPLTWDCKTGGTWGTLKEVQF